jgi:hypothetical protein
MPISTPRYRIEGTRDEIDAVEAAVATALARRQMDIDDDQRKVKEFEDRIAAHPTETNTINGHNAHMREFWRGQLQADQQKLERLDLALSVARRAAVVEPPRRRR